MYFLSSSVLVVRVTLFVQPTEPPPYGPTVAVHAVSVAWSSAPGAGAVVDS